MSNQSVFRTRTFQTRVYAPRTFGGIRSLRTVTLEIIEHPATKIIPEGATAIKIVIPAATKINQGSVDVSL